MFADAASSLVAQAVQSGPPMPLAFDDNIPLFVFNLFAMPATTFLGAIMMGKQARV
ncbi:hypothetical protein [uncultured Novosphingobium sp.]|uniref:hypothetical protein n=1 Tax=uncultured Novosphingobium sp. TaxID=292277 RepID=UPI003749BA8C